MSEPVVLETIWERPIEGGVLRAELIRRDERLFIDIRIFRESDGAMRPTEAGARLAAGDFFTLYRSATKAVNTHRTTARAR